MRRRTISWAISSSTRRSSTKPPPISSKPPDSLRAMPIFTLITVARSNVSTARMRPALNTKRRCGWVRNQRGSITTTRCFSGEPVRSIRRSTEFQAALKYNPKSAEAHYDLGSALGLKGDIEGAKMHYLMAQRLNPKRTAVYDDLGVLYLRQGQLAEGIAQLKEALRLEPNDTLASRKSSTRGRESKRTPRNHFQPALR